MTDAIEFIIPSQDKLQVLDGRQIAIMLENTFSTLRTEMSKKQIREFVRYWGTTEIAEKLSDD